MSALALRFMAGAMVILLAAACGGDAFQSEDDGVKDDGGGGDGGQSGSGGSGTGGGIAASGGSAGTSGAGGDGGAGTGGVSAGGTAGNVHGDSGFVDGSAGSAVLDGSAGGANDASDGAILDAGTCDAPIVYYRDQDDDKYGLRDSDRPSCTPLADGWTDQPGDCNDERADVNPLVEAYWGDPYGSGSTESFDYDCNGNEEPDPSQFGAASTCPGLALGACNKKGFAPTSRSGPNVNPYCGSRTLVTCLPNGLNCTTGISQVSPKRCR